MKEFFSSFWGDLTWAIIVMLITIVINKLINKLIERVIKNKDNKNITTVLIFVRKLKTIIIYIIGFLIAISFFSIFSTLSVTLLSAIGIGAGILGLALQDSLKNFLGSVELVVNKPFEVGDYINLPEKGINGIVEEIDMRHTVLRNFNNQREILPNSILNDLIIQNSDFKDNEIVFFCDYAIGYSADLEKAINIIKEEVLKQCGEIKFKGALKDTEYPKVRVIEWDSSSINLRAWIWGNTSGEAFENKCQLNEKIKIRFDKEGIEIPYNYINVINKK